MCINNSCCTCVNSSECDRAIFTTESKVKEYAQALDYYLASMNCAVSKAKNGSTVEDGYFFEKLNKLVGHLGYKLVKA